MAPVRLRSRSRRSSGSGLVADGPFDRWTTVGNLDSPVAALVDPAGGSPSTGAGWSLDWWIGAEDRWHLPARGGGRAPAARRRQPGGGDAGPHPERRRRVTAPTAPAARAARTCSWWRSQNDSKVPVALALAVQPHDAAAASSALALAGSRAPGGRCAGGAPRPLTRPLRAVDRGRRARRAARSCWRATPSRCAPRR